MTTLTGSLARVVFVCGLAVALTAATVGSAFFGVTTWLTLVPLGAGLVAAAAGGVASLRGARVDGRGARAVVECAVVVVLAVAANVVALRFPAAVDVTRSKRNTLAEQSVQVARALKEPVVVRAVLDADDRAFADLRDLVERYRRETSELTLERVQPAAGAANGDDKVVLVAGDRRQKVHFEAGAPDQEAQLTRALKAIETRTRARVYVLAGHGEAAVDDDGPPGLRRLGQALVDEGFEVVPLPLAAVGRVPEDAAAVIVAGARPFLAPPSGDGDAGAPSSARGDGAALQRYLDGGGRLLLLLEPGGEDFASLLGSVGVQPNGDVVIDNSSFSGLLGGPDTATGVAYATHPVTAKLGGALTHFLHARSLAENPGTPATVTALVQTGADTWGETHLVPGTPPQKDDADIAGPLTMMMAVTAPGGARVAVAGDATFAENRGIGLGANRDLAVNAVLWLADKQSDIAVRARGRGGNLLLLTPTARERIAFVLLYGMPVLLLCAGLAISAVRRRR